MSEPEKEMTDQGALWHETAEQRSERMSWFREARFGLFIHWGPYSLLGKGEWAQHSHRVPFKEYEAIAAALNPVKFDAAETVRLAKTAGMKYLVITSKHHDGFCMWDSALTDYNIVKWTQFKRDPIAELAAECRKQGIKFGIYYSPRDWHHPDYVLRYEELGAVYQYGSSRGYAPDKWMAGKPYACGCPSCASGKPMTKECDPRPTEAEGADMNRYIDYMKGQLEELLTRFQPDMLWFDGQDIKDRELSRLDEIFAMLRNHCPKIIINDRFMKGGTGDFESLGHENRLPAKQPTRDWEACDTLGVNWGYEKASECKPLTTLIRMLCNATAMSGNLLLNISPDGEGVVPSTQIERLQEMGQWLQVNGESIYGCGAAAIPEQKWGKVTAKEGRLYCHIYDWPEDGKLVIETFQGTPEKAWLLATAEQSALEIQKNGDDLVVTLPAKAPEKLHAVLCLDVN
jgi:alpha-L-fucosidase